MPNYTIYINTENDKWFEGVTNKGPIINKLLEAYKKSTDNAKTSDQPLKPVITAIHPKYSEPHYVPLED